MAEQFKNFERVRPVGDAAAALVAFQGVDADAETFGGLRLRPALALAVGDQAGYHRGGGERVALGSATAGRVRSGWGFPGSSWKAIIMRSP